jgi:hypothetical protein
MIVFDCTSALENKLSELLTFSSNKFFDVSPPQRIFATLLLPITALFRKPKAREDPQLECSIVRVGL